MTFNHPAADVHTQKAAEPDPTLVRLHEALPAEHLQAALDLDAVVAGVLAGSK